MEIRMRSCGVYDIFQKSSSSHFRGATPNSKTSVFSLTACDSTRYGPWKCMEIGVLFKQTVLFFHQTLTSASHKEGTISKMMHRLPLIFQGKGKALSFGGEQCDHEPCVGPLILEPFSAVAVPSATRSHVSQHWRPAPPYPWYVPRDLIRSANPLPPEKLPLRWAQKPVICRGAKTIC